MNKYFNITSLCLSAFLVTMSPLCQADPESNPHKAMPNMENSTGKIYGKVIETINAGNYTYVHVDTGKEKHWAASPPVTLKKGSMVSFVPNMPMKNFASKTLNRKFDVVYFVGQIYTDKVSDHPVKTDPHKLTKQTSSKPVPNIKKAENGHTIDEIFKRKQELAGQIIRVRGEIVKYTPNIMGKNWLHIRDNSNSNDLTITTNISNSAIKGNIVLAVGKILLNQDFGYGYTYDVLMEDATITVEK